VQVAPSRPRLSFGQTAALCQLRGRGLGQLSVQGAWPSAQGAWSCVQGAWPSAQWAWPCVQGAWPSAQGAWSLMAVMMLLLHADYTHKHIC